MLPHMAAPAIPSQIADIDVAWLNEVLSDEFGTITAASAERFGEGVGILGELARFTLTYADGHSGPATLVAKCASPSEENQFLALAMGFYVREVNFYRHVADGVDVRVPRPYHAASSDTGVPFVLLIEDIAGATTPDQLAGLSVDEVTTIISTIAPLHIQFWGSDQLDSLDWLPPMNNDMYKGGAPLATALFPSFAEHFGDRIPADFMATIGGACERYAELLDYTTTIGAPTFTHTDCRAENYLFGGPDGDDAVTVIDFQLSTRHIGMWDVTNLVAGSMDPELRKQHETAIIQRYVDQIVAAGIDYSLDQAMHEYRVCLLQQMAAQVITSDLQGGNDRGAELLEQLHLRPVLAAIDNDAGSILDLF
jgi:Ecdysteroid kinase-like family